MFCSHCGKEISKEDEFCPKCGQKLGRPSKEDVKESESKIEKPKEILSGEQKEYLDKWSWGAFGLTFVWLIFSKLGWFALLYITVPYIPIIGPIIGITAVIYFAIKGRRRSWTTGKWDSFSQFKERQRKLDKAGKIFLVVWVGIAVVGVLSTLVLLQLGTARARARDAKRIADVNQIRTAVEQYFEDSRGVYPAAIDQAHIGKYVTKIPADPLTNKPYEYLFGPENAPTSYVVWAELEQRADALNRDADIVGGDFDGSHETCTDTPSDCIYDQGYIAQ